jgi:glycerophosphoryl diester phosphodiesterase
MNQPGLSAPRPRRGQAVRLTIGYHGGMPPTRKLNPRKLVRLLTAASALGLLCLIPSQGRSHAGGEAAQVRSAPPTFIAHRGYSQNYPENTVASIREAVAHGAEWVEIDVRWSRDGEPVLHHDADFEDDRGAARPIDGAALAEIQADRIAGSGESIPTLRQAVEAMSDNRAKLYLHLKGPEIGVEEARKLIGLCRSLKFVDRVRFNSGSFATLKNLRDADPAVWLEYDLYDAKGLFWSNRPTLSDLRSIRELAVRSVGTFSFKIDEGLVREAHRAGLLVDALVSAHGMPFHGEGAAYREMLRIGVDEIMTDEIARYLGPGR